MQHMGKIKIGLFGFGVVGQGIYEVVRKSKNANAEIVKICVRSLDKPRSIDRSHFTDSPAEILDNPEIDLIVEVIDDAKASYDIVKSALLKGIPVVSGNKTMLAHHLPEMIEIQKKHNVALLYDASSCGSIPVIRNLEGKMQYVCGGEESFGFLAEDFVRDKDAVSACSLAAEAAAWAKSQGMTLYDLLKEIYVKYGFFDEALVSIVRQGKEGQEEIARMMTQYRNNPPQSLGGSPVITVKDYLTGESLDVKSGRKTPIDMEKSNVLQFITADSTIVSIRPSGTEPKIKFYFGVRGELCCEDKFEETRQTMERKIESIKQEMKLI